MTNSFVRFCTDVINWRRISLFSFLLPSLLCLHMIRLPFYGEMKMYVQVFITITQQYRETQKNSKSIVFSKGIWPCPPYVRRMSQVWADTCSVLHTSSAVRLQRLRVVQPWVVRISFTASPTNRGQCKLDFCDVYLTTERSSIRSSAWIDNWHVNNDSVRQKWIVSMWPSSWSLFCLNVRELNFR